MDLVVARREPAGVGEQIRTGGGGAEALEVVGRGKQLVLQQPRLDAVGLGAQEVHPELQIVARKELVGVGVELRVLLIQMPWRPQIAERHRRQVAEDRQVAVVHRAS